jgi:hypothetical protein
MREGVLLDEVHVSGRDIATRIDIVAEIALVRGWRV